MYKQDQIFQDQIRGFCPDHGKNMTGSADPGHGKNMIRSLDPGHGKNMTGSADPDLVKT